MSEIKTKYTLKGTRILTGETLKRKIEFIDKFRKICLDEGFEEMEFPNVTLLQCFKDKLGDGDTSKQTYTFKDNGNRDLILNPEITAICQELANELYKYQKNKKIFYIQKCYRGENTQKGRYREFTQIGVEILNPTEDYLTYLSDLSLSICKILTSEDEFETNLLVKRGLGYYIDGEGFEISYDKLGGQKQICGGGKYKEGIGFAIGLDRLLLI